MASYEQKQLKKALQDLGSKYVKELTKQLLQANKKVSGELIRSLDWKVLNTVNGFVLNIISSNYLQYVDKGRRPNSKMPPVKPIQKWVKAKGITFKGKTDEQTAFIISRSIGKKGIKPTNVIKKTQLILQLNRNKLIHLAAKQDLSELIKKTFNNL